jgi:hypothetical protein
VASLLLVLNWCAHELQSGSVIHHCGLRAGCGIMDMCFMALMAPSGPGASFLAMMTSSRHVAFMEVMASSRRAASHRRCGLHVGDGVQQSRAQPSFW